MAGRPCSICSDSAKARRAAELIAGGATDQAISDALRVGRMSVQRHRTAHVVAPAKALVEAAGKGLDVRNQRAQVLAAAEAGDPSAFVALAGIVNDLKKVHERLERTADAAETDNQRLAVASLSSQQLRAAEVRAKIGGVGAYAPQKGQGGAEAPMFSLTINFGGGRTERIDMTAADHAPGPPIVDMRPDQPRDVTTVVECPELLPEPMGDGASDEAELSHEEDV
jgi:hypothetical protein